MSDRPVKLSVCSTDTGWASIRADGVRVGHARRGNRRWQAYLWNEPENRSGGYAEAPVVREYLRELRADLRERVELKGAWWSETAATG